MRRPFDPPPYDELVRAAMTATGATGGRQLANAIGLHGRDEDKVVNNWINGKNAPNYDGTMRLLAAAGWLDLSAKRAKRPLEESESDEVAQVLRELEELLRRHRGLGGE